MPKSHLNHTEIGISRLRFSRRMGVFIYGLESGAVFAGNSRNLNHWSTQRQVRAPGESGTRLLIDRSGFRQVCPLCPFVLHNGIA